MGMGRRVLHQVEFLAEDVSGDGYLEHILIEEENLMSKSKSNPKHTPLKPGEHAPVSGQYEIVGPRGGRTGIERTSTEGHPLPPTLQPGQGYVPVDPTKTKG